MEGAAVETPDRQKGWKDMDWNELNAQETAKPYYKDLYEFVTKEYSTGACYPPFDRVMRAMALTPYEKVKCVILGQDPYHNPGEAMGLSFSVPKGVRIPPSLQNIYQELHRELGCGIPSHGDLTKWAGQGVLLLNAILTVRAHTPASHQGHGWEQYTDAVLSAVNQKQGPVVYMLWGNYARSKRYLLDNPAHLVLEARHPSPYSANAGFFGCGHFRRCNEYLAKNGQEPIDWQIE